MLESLLGARVARLRTQAPSRTSCHGEGSVWEEFSSTRVPDIPQTDAAFSTHTRHPSDSKGIDLLEVSHIRIVD